MAADQKEITRTDEHDRSQEPVEKNRGITAVDALTFSVAAGDVLKDFLSIGCILAGNGFTKKEPQKETKMKLMKLSIRIPMGLTIADVILGIVVFTRISSQTGALPMTPFIIWIISCVILIGITIWSALGFKGINKRK